MKLFSTFFFSALLSVQGLQAQESTWSKFGPYLDIVPKPLATIDATMEAFPEASVRDRLFGRAVRELDASRKDILNFFLQIFSTGIQNINAAPGKIPIGTEERKLLESYRVSTAGLGAEAKITVLVRLMEQRSEAALQKLSWTRISGSLTTEGRVLYEKLVGIEKELAVRKFLEEVTARNPSGTLFSRDEEMTALNTRFQVEMEKLPVKKVKLLEGSDLTTEIRDPEKMIVLIEETEAKRKAMLARRYNELFEWWEKAFGRTAGAAAKIDALLEATGAPDAFQGPDRQLLPVIRDVQERTWSMLLQLQAVASGLVDQSFVLAAAQYQKAQLIAMYKGYAGRK